jgi:hypothetical protein
VDAGPHIVSCRRGLVAVRQSPNSRWTASTRPDRDDTGSAAGHRRGGSGSPAQRWVRWARNAIAD